MAVIRIQAQKDARCMQAVCQIHGDRRTQILRFDVNRYDGGVDLGNLRWVIKTTNALGVDDIFDPEAVEIKERTISVDWLVDGSVTDATGIAGYELNGIDTAKDGQPVQWSGGLGSISVRAGKGPKFGETDGMTNIEKLILYVEGELQSVIEAGDAAAAAAERANRAADNIEDVAGTIAHADAAAQRATQAAEAVEDLEGAVNRANAAAASVNNAVMNAETAASNAYGAANRAKEAADAVENITEAVTAAHEAAETANNAAATANEAALPHVVLYGTRVHGETAKASGNPVTFLPDAGSLLQPMTVLEPKQAGSGDPSPTNIRPITGYDALNLNLAGKNLIPYYNFSSGYSDGGVTVQINADKTLTFSGTATRDAYFYLSTYSSTYTTGYVLPAGEYVLSGCPAGGGTQSYRMALSLYKDGVWQSGGCTDYGSGGKFTIPEGHKVDLYIRFPSGTNANGVTFKPMIRLASVADDTYEPYQYTTYTVQIGQTVYGGKFDWLTGKLTLEWGFVELGGNAQFYSPNTMVYPNGERIRVTYVLPNFAQDSADELQLICNQFVNDHKIGGWGSGPIDNVWILTGHPDWLAMALPVSVFGTTEASVKAKFAETPLQVAYKLKTPIEIQLTPHIISAADPEQNNTLYGDGNVEVDYVKPLHVSIEERVAAAVAAAMNAEGV